MSGETNLARLLQSMTPHLNPGQYVFCCVAADHDCSALRPLASVQEALDVQRMVEAILASG